MSAMLPLPMMSCYLHTGLSPSGLQNYRSFPAITVFWSKCSAYWKHSYSAFSNCTCCENISKFTCYYCKILTKNVPQKLPPITLLSLNERWARPKPSPWFRELSWSSLPWKLPPGAPLDLAHYAGRERGASVFLSGPHSPFLVCLLRLFVLCSLCCLFILNPLNRKKQVTPEALYAGWLNKEVISVVTHC